MEFLAPYLDQIIYYSLEIVKVIGDVASKLLETYFPS